MAKVAVVTGSNKGIHSNTYWKEFIVYRPRIFEVPFQNLTKN